MVENEFHQMFNEYYYAHDCGIPYERNETWMSFFGKIAERIIAEINPKTVLDAGCAMGFLVVSLRTRGIETWGIDISEYAINKVHQSIKPYCQVKSITQELDQKYDLIISIEVVEHMQKLDAEDAIKNLCQYSDQILFSSTPFDYKENTHINVQLPEYWAGLFALNGFFRDFNFDASFITPWAVLYKKRTYQIGELVREYESKYFQLWKENVDLRQVNIDQQKEMALSFEELSEAENQIFVYSNNFTIKIPRIFKKIKRMLGLQISKNEPN